MVQLDAKFEWQTPPIRRVGRPAALSDTTV
jgi:hypothetical protein